MSVKDFFRKWSSTVYEKGEAQPFWLSLLRDVFNIAEPENFISFEVPIPHEVGRHFAGDLLHGF